MLQEQAFLWRKETDLIFCKKRESKALIYWQEDSCGDKRSDTIDISPYEAEFEPHT